MKRLLKFLHTLGGIGLMGSVASLLAIVHLGPAPATPADYVLLVHELAAVATWVFYPAMVLTLVAGLLAIAVNPTFQNAGWVGAKLATGVLIFEAGLVYVQGPLAQEARRSSEAVGGDFDMASVTAFVAAERNTLCIMLLVSAANVALGVWRPRFSRRAR